MNPLKFGPDKTGHLVPVIYHDKPNHAFIPDPLPPKWAIRESMWPLIASARESLARLDGVGRVLPNPRLMLRPLQKREAICSSNLEGTFATPRELALFEMENPQGAAARADTPQESDWMEVLQYYTAMRLGSKFLRDGVVLDGEFVKTLHKTLLRGTRGNTKQPGEYRTYQVHVGSNKRYLPPPPDQIQSLMTNLDSYLADSVDPMDKLVRAFVAHYQFEAIHPFGDGNGRVGRLLLSLSVFRWLNHNHPWLYLSEYFDKNRDDYIRLLFSISTEGAWEEWVTFCLQGTIEQADASARRIDKLLSLQQKYDRLLQQSKAHSLIKRIFTNGMIRVVDVQKQLKVSYATARSYINEMVENDIVEELPDTYPKTFVAGEVFDVAYGESTG